MSAPNEHSKMETEDVKMMDVNEDVGGPSTSQDSSCKLNTGERTYRDNIRHTQETRKIIVTTNVSITLGQILPKIYVSGNQNTSEVNKSRTLVANVPTRVFVDIPSCLKNMRIYKPPETEQMQIVNDLKDMIMSYNILSFKDTIQNTFEENPWIFEEFLSDLQEKKCNQGHEKRTSSKRAKSSSKKQQHSHQSSKNSEYDGKKHHSQQNARRDRHHHCLLKGNYKINKMRMKHWNRLENRYNELKELNMDFDNLDSTDLKRFHRKLFHYERDAEAFKQEWNSRLVSLTFLTPLNTQEKKAISTARVEERVDDKKKYNEYYRHHSRRLLREDLQYNRKKAREMIHNNNRPTLLTMSEAEVENINEGSLQQLKSDENIIEYLMSSLSL